MTTHFCLDIGETRVKVADVVSKGASLEALSMGMELIDPLFFKSDSEDVVEKTAKIVSNLLKQLKVSKKNVSIVLPDSFTYNQFIEVPLLNEKELFSAIKYQADQFIPMPLTEVNLDIEIVYEDAKTGKMMTLIAASPKKTIERVQKLAEHCGLIPDSAETETSALGRLFSTIYPKKPAQGEGDSGQLIVNLQNSSSSVYFFDENLGLITYSHNFQLGYALFLKEIQVNLNVDGAKSVEILSTMGLLEHSSYDLQTVLAPSIKNFATEVDRSINELTSKRKSKINKIVLLNEAVNFKGLDQLLGKYFGVPVEVFNPIQVFEKNNVINYFKNDLVYFATTFGGALS